MDASMDPHAQAWAYIAQVLKIVYVAVMQSKCRELTVTDKYGEKVVMIGRMESEKLPRCWGGRDLEEEVGISLGGCQISRLRKC